MMKAPKEVQENIRFRRLLIRLGSTDRWWAEEIWIACRRDPIFFFDAFLATFNPKLRGNKWLPFITWEYQEEAIHEIIRCIMPPAGEEQEDLGIEKSRDMGATVIVLGVMLWLFLFYDDMSFLLGSNKQESVDKAGNHKALFQKLDAMLRRLPMFLRYPVDVDDDSCRTKNHLGNPATGSAFDGEATVSNFGRSDRRTAILMDEFAEWNEGHQADTSTADVADCRIVNSTHQGSHTAFYAFMQRVQRKLRLHWSRHPAKARGLYTTEGGALKILDPNWAPPKNYPFILDGKTRSPWYDKQCVRRTNRSIAQELDIDVEGAAGQFFDVTGITLCISNCRPAVRRGEVVYDKQKLVLTGFRDDGTFNSNNDDGLFRFWFDIGPVPMLPSFARYVIGGDVSHGTGSTNSVWAVWDKTALRRVADYHSSHIDPNDFAEIGVVLSRFFNDALVIWDVQGIGQTVAQRFRRVGFGNTWKRPVNMESPYAQQSDKAGFVMMPGPKMTILKEYDRALYSGDAINPCKQALEECLQFIDTPNGPEHSKALMKAMNPASEGKFHGDFVIADALAWHLLEPMAMLVESIREEHQQPPASMSTFAGRRELFQRSKKDQEYVY